MPVIISSKKYVEKMKKKNKSLPLDGVQIYLLVFVDDEQFGRKQYNTCIWNIRQIVLLSKFLLWRHHSVSSQYSFSEVSCNGTVTWKQHDNHQKCLKLSAYLYQGFFLQPLHDFHLNLWLSRRRSRFESPQRLMIFIWVRSCTIHTG